MTILLQGGTVLDQRGQRVADVVIDETTGQIQSVGPVDSTATDGSRHHVLDATGCVVCPGFVDLNVHVRQPGNEAAETIDSAAEAAALGGYTAVLAMPDTDPCLDSAAVVSEVLALAKSAACEVVPTAALTVDRLGLSLAPVGELIDVGIRFFSDGGTSIADAGLLRRAMEYLGGVAEAAGVHVVIANEPDLETLSGRGVMNEGEWSSRLGLPGRPAVAEELSVGRDLSMARLTGTPLHLQQITTAGSVALIRAAKAEGLGVTAEVSPHHLVLDESACEGYDPNVKVLPPLRTKADIEALRVGVLDGTIDAIATNHSPWAVDTKEQPFDEAPFGVIGLQTALAVLLTDLDVTLADILPALSWHPAAIAGLADRHGQPVEAGRQANLTVVDPDAAWTIEPASMASRSRNSPFAGREVRGRIRHTIVKGRATVVDGRSAATNEETS